jgi:hypothetical protein
LKLYFSPTDKIITSGIPTIDTYVVKMVTTMTYTVISGGGAFIAGYGGAGFSFNVDTVHTGTGITFNTADPTCTLLAITKNNNITQPTVSPYYLNAQYFNLCYNRSFSSTVASYEPLCFGGGYIFYDITWIFSTAPTAYTALSFGLANNTGTALLTGYNGRTCLLGDTYSQVGWTTLAFVAYCFAGNYQTYKMTISYPNTARRKVITGTNNGSANGTTFLDCPHIATGQNSTTTAYNSMYWSLVGTGVSGTIYVSGRNH